MGYDAVKTALAASKGEQVPAQVYIDASLITKANMNSARSQLLSCNDLHAFRVVIRFRVLLRGQYFLDGIGRDHRAPRNRRQTTRAQLSCACERLLRAQQGLLRRRKQLSSNNADATRPAASRFPTVGADLLVGLPTQLLATLGKSGRTGPAAPFPPRG